MSGRTIVTLVFTESKNKSELKERDKVIYDERGWGRFEAGRSIGKTGNGSVGTEC